MAKFDDDPENDYLASGARRCHAQRTNGLRCTQPAREDQNVCRFHGGNIERNLIAAEKKRIEREAQKLLGKWDPDPEPVQDPVGALARMAGQAESLKDMAFRACEPHSPCEACGREETDGTAFVAFTMVARQLTQMLVSIDKIGLRERIMQHNQEQLMILLAALNDAMVEMFPEVDAQRVQLQERFLARVGHWEAHFRDLPDVIRTQSRGGGSIVLRPDIAPLPDDADDGDWLS